MLEKLANEGKVAPPKPERATKTRRQKERRAAKSAHKKPCPGTNLRGEPCKAYPLNRGTVVDDVEASGDFCLFHEPAFPPDSWKNWKQKQNTTEITRNHALPRAIDLLAHAVSQSPEILFASQMEALGKEWDADTGTFKDKIRNGKPDPGATHVGFSRDGDASRSRYKDFALQAKIENNLADRLFGKAKMSMDLAGEGTLKMPEVPQTAERAYEVVNILAECKAIPPENTSGQE